MAHPATCAMDATAGTAELLQTGIQLWSSIEVCKEAPNGDDRTKTVCIADAAGVVAALTNVAQYLLAVLESCAGQHLLHARCAQTALILTGSISGAAGAATSLSTGCRADKFK